MTMAATAIAMEMDPLFDFLSSQFCTMNVDGDITLSLRVFATLLSIIFLLGGCIGFVLGKRGSLGGGRVSTQIKVNEPSLEFDRDENRGSELPQKKLTEEEKAEDGPTMVLRGSLDLLASKWGNGCDSQDVNSAVVEYLSPEKMTELLFSKVNDDQNGFSNMTETMCLDEYNKFGEAPSPKSSTADIVNLILSSKEGKQNPKSTNNITSSQFLKLLSLIQKYSVNTSHPYFFNQLFGSLDPIALAAEIVALSVNTSVYTYETAPVFTLLEREVMGQIGKLVFSKNENGGDGEEQEEEESDEFEGEGLMIPGGSLANLTAMHAARHRWKVMNGYTTSTANQDENDDSSGLITGQEESDYWATNDGEEEKKLEDSSSHGPTSSQQPQQQEDRTEHQYLCNYNSSEPPDLVAFVSSEAHYSFSKSARVLGLREDDLITIPTHSDGRMDVGVLAKRIEELEMIDLQRMGNSTGTTRSSRRRVPFFVACTAGSTVRGSFDEIAKIVKVCRAYESRGGGSAAAAATMNGHNIEQRSIWVHVDGAWGGSAIFSTRTGLRASTHMDEIRLADSFTFNPHKMLGAPQQTTAFIVRHRNALREANEAGAKYLFDPRKNGAEYDLGDLSYTCGRRTDAVKLWALWKYYGRGGLGARVDQKVDELDMFVEELERRAPKFALACKPWPFNVNFFYFPPRIRKVLEDRGIVVAKGSGKTWLNGNNGHDDYIQIPEDIAEDLANVSVTLKLRLHEAGEMIIPYQPLNNQKADCFRLVLAGKKDFGIKDICHILDTMDKYGSDL